MLLLLHFKRQSEHSGLRPDTSSLVYYLCVMKVRFKFLFPTFWWNRVERKNKTARRIFRLPLNPYGILSGKIKNTENLKDLGNTNDQVR